ncbi:L-xylulose reductase, partial [Stegodyphus mimosarum]
MGICIFRAQVEITSGAKKIPSTSPAKIMDIRFDGKRAIVTGAGKGIGRALTLKLIECGAEVIAISRTQSDLDELRKISPKIQPLCLDIGVWDATKEAINNIGPVDYLVNNAAILLSKEYGELTEEDLNNTLNINVKAIVNITQIVANGMKERGLGGSIVNVSSMLALYAVQGYGSYCASKGAVHQLTRSMALEYGSYNIRVNSVNPTVVRTPMTEKINIFDPSNEFGTAMKNRTPLRRFCEPEDVVYPILFLLSDKAAMVTGIAMPIDGGLGICF